MAFALSQLMPATDQFELVLAEDSLPRLAAATGPFSLLNELAMDLSDVARCEQLLLGIASVRQGRERHYFYVGDLVLLHVGPQLVVLRRRHNAPSSLPQQLELEQLEELVTAVALAQYAAASRRNIRLSA